MTTVGTALIRMLEHLGTEYVFGIPGVHTVELYRGLAESPIHHITPRHEQGAGFMADGYARASGKPGVCLLITGPGLTNALTAMAQALQDSIPMLVITGVNPVASFGQGRGLLHELPDQQGLIRALTPHSHSLRRAEDLPDLLAQAYAVFASARPGPVHIEIPTDLMAAPMPAFEMPQVMAQPPCPTAAQLQQAADLITAAQAPLILAGGGCRGAAEALTRFATQIDAPVISTANARRVMGDDPLHVPASASLPAVRDQIARADLVIGLGTEMGPTDYDVYVDGGLPPLQRFLRVDIDPARLRQDPPCDLGLTGAVKQVLDALMPQLPARAAKQGAQRAEQMRQAALPAPDSVMASDLQILHTVAQTLPGCTIVGDSTQIVYSGNLCLPHDALPGDWFNAATGFGTLGYAPAAAIGAALARPDHPVVCLVGDGGLQFSLAELASAIDAGTPVIFLVWNNQGYKEIETYMRAARIAPVGVTPSGPDLMHLARAYGLCGVRVPDLSTLRQTLSHARHAAGPTLIELQAGPDGRFAAPN